MASERINPLKLVLTLALDYLRWTQLAPMLTVWAFGLAMLAALVFVNYQEETFDAVGALAHWIAGLPLIGERFTAWMESQAGDDGAISLGGNDLKAAALKAWSILSLVFMVIALTIGWLFGPFKPWPLKRKLLVTAVCCLALLACFITVNVINPEEFNGPLSSWMITFGGITTILFVVSAWCLSIAHLLLLWRRAVEASSLGASAQANQVRPGSGVEL